MSAEHGTDESTAGLSAERIGRNDSIFRGANEQINEVAEAAQIEGQRSPFICECADMSCHEIILLTLAEYSAIREDSRLFLNVPGHEASSQGWAQVVETHESYVVVEKIGPAGEVADQLEGSLDPATAVIDGERRHHRNDRV